MANNVRQINSSDQFESPTSFMSPSRGRIYSDIPMSAKEVRAVGKIIRPNSLFLGKKAKEEYFKQEASDFGTIHLATHCFIDESRPMYCEIAFAQDDDPAEDGLLYTYEVFNLDLNAELVTLSACETGLGKLSRGEGLIGLTRAFMYAGASSVLVSLWSVDESTGELMEPFYTAIQENKTKAEALRMAKLELIKTTKNGISFSHPYLWAPFILVGQWE